MDSVSAVIENSEEQVEPPPDFGSGVNRDFTRGVAKVGGRFVVMLEADRALDVDEMSRLCEAAELPWQ